MATRFLAHSNRLRMLPTTSPKRNDRKLMGIRAAPISVQSRNPPSGGAAAGRYPSGLDAAIG
jgi:hypothetical protein